MRWLHRGVKSLSQAEQLLKRDHRDGAFFVYRTKSEHSPYIVAFRSVLERERESVREREIEWVFV